MKKTKLTRSLLAAVSVVALSAVVYGCSSGHSDADLNAAAEKAKMEAEAAAAEKAKMEAEEAARKAEEDKQAALEAERQKAAEQAAAAEKMARATAQTNAITGAITAAEAALGMVGLDASDADITAAEEAIAAITTAIEAAVDVDDTSMYATQAASLQGRLMTAKANIQEDKDAETARLAQIEAAKVAIAAAETAEAAQAAKDALNDVATAVEAAVLQAAVNDRITALETMAREADQKMALTTAAGNVDTSDLSDADAIAAANTAIAALKAALAAAADVSDAEKAMYQSQVAAAETAVMAAQSALNHAAQTMALSDAVTALQAIDLSGLSTKAEIDAAEMAINNLRDALAAADELSDAEKTAAMIEVAAASRIVMAAENRVDTEGQQMVLDDAAKALAAIDLNALMTQEQIDAANKAIAALDAALNAATNLDDTDKIDAIADVTVAKRKVAIAEEMLTENVGNQRMALSDAKADLDDIDLDDLSDQAKIDAAQAAVDALKMALDEATHLSEADKAMYQSQLDTATETVRTAQTGMDRDGRMMAQRTAVTNAVTAVTTAVAAVNDTATDDQVMAADEAIADLKMAIDDAEDLPEGDTDVAAAKGTLASLMTVLERAKTSRTAAMEKAEEDRLAMEREEERKRNEANAATAAKLYAGIGEPTASDATPTADIRFAGYEGDDIEVQDGVADTDAVTLSEDKKTTVAANHGWEGKRYAVEPDDDGMYEAIVYSNVGEPTEGDPFDEEYSDSLTEGVLATEITEGTPARIASSRFDHSTGVKEFELPENNVQVMIPGDYHGVSGTYSCTAATDSTCAVQVATVGYALGGTSDGTNAFSADGGTWTFKPSDPKDKVMSAADMAYSSYGWWLHTDADGKLTASAFHAFKGDVPDDEAVSALPPAGTATYMGGAAGKYALSSATGGTNDAGHFTARATLEADFGDDTITGTIDDFTGADGEGRDWSVELMKSNIAATGGIAGDPDDDTDTGNQMTQWTIGGTAADADGQWSGNLRELDADTGVPQVATGTFYSEYGTAGKMVGAFGANKQ
ncbi:MAG: hypothetical protein OXE50_14955 [Chloroflexi bacterium]|nr:hypothetical protein [Chloroflexota bacterium]